ncbi:MAG: lamin tail domain-containing protein [Sedimentisphaerales bacterium]
MQKELKKHVECRRAFTLVELILVTAMVAIVATALVGMIYSNYKSWRLGSGRSTLLQDGRAVLEQMTRIIRQSKGFSSVSSPTDQAGQITFTDVDGVTQQFRLNTLTSQIEFGPPASLSALIGSVSNLVFTCYDANDNNLADPVQVRNIQSVGIVTTLTDGTNSFILSGRVFCPKDFQNLVINELMYNPIGKKAAEWVELYNSSSSAIDVTGWTIWTTKVQHSDTLIADPVFGNGSMVIPAGGYAVIIAKNTEVAGVDPNAVRLSVNNTKIGNSLSDTGDIVVITDGSATIDSVTYSSSWGGNGDGTSLSRIDPQGDSNSQSNWKSGPVNGTPGSANP